MKSAVIKVLLLVIAIGISMCPGASVVDLAATKYSSSLTDMIGDDGVHPNWAGDAAIAESWLAALQQSRVARQTEM